jgi:preprotein translocase subunit Sss1
MKNNKNSNYDITTSDELIELAKLTLTTIIIESCKSEFGDDDEEFYEEVENNIFDYTSFFAKVRKGEIWNEEMGRVAVDKFLKEIENNLYKHV